MNLAIFYILASTAILIIGALSVCALMQDTIKNSEDPQEIDYAAKWQARIIPDWMWPLFIRLYKSWEQ